MPQAGRSALLSANRLVSLHGLGRHLASKLSLPVEIALYVYLCALEDLRLDGGVARVDLAFLLVLWIAVRCSWNEKWGYVEIQVLGVQLQFLLFQSLQKSHVRAEKLSKRNLIMNLRALRRFLGLLLVLFRYARAINVAEWGHVALGAKELFFEGLKKRELSSQ